MKNRKKISKIKIKNKYIKNWKRKEIINAWKGRWRMEQDKEDSLLELPGKGGRS